MENERHYFTVGLFVLVSLVAAVVTLLWFSPLGTRQMHTTYAIYFDGAVSGLSVGAPVQLKGINVGRVNAIAFESNEDDKIRVLATIVDTAPIRKDTVASIRLQGITGASVLALENSGEDPSPIKKKKGQPYKVIRSTPSQLEQFFNDLPHFIDRLTGLADRGQALMSDENIAAFSTLLTSSSSAMTDISALAKQGRALVGGQANNELQDVLTEAKIAMREIKMLARSLREDPSKIIRGPKYEGHHAEE